MKKLKNITRIDNDVNRTYAWLVQVQRNYQSFRQYFSDGVYGGKRKALLAAKEFQATVSANLTTSVYHHNRCNIVRRNNTSGIPGVGRYDPIDNPNTGHRVVFWLAFWTDEHGVPHKRKFAVSKYGERKAKQLAVAERKRRLQEVCAAKCG